MCCTLSAYTAYTEFMDYCCRLLMSLEFCFKACALGVRLVQKRRRQGVYAIVLQHVNQLLINFVPITRECAA